MANFQSRVAESDALIIASPEYAHGVTGTIKNALTESLNQGESKPAIDVQRD